jgi:hypothetical protein
MTGEDFPRPQFEAADLPLDDTQLVAREDWMMDHGNWRGDHSVPSVGEHYRYMWKWDSLKAVVINARRGDPDKAALEFTTLERYRDPETGFMANKIFATADHKTFRDYPEAWNFNDNKSGSSYSQPPIAAWAALETYRSFQKQGRTDDALYFLAATYGTAADGNYTGLQGEHAYFINHRQNSADDPLIGIVHPNETGRDSDEATKPWLLREGKSDSKNEWLRMQILGYHLGRLGADPQKKRIDWIPGQVKEKYWVNDVMFNAMHANNLRNLADIAGILSESTDDFQEKRQYHQDIEKYRDVADGVEKEVLSRMWDSEQGFFYNLDEHGVKIPVDSIGGLFPLMLENISEKQVVSLLDKLEDPEWFATPYPIPTHAVRSVFYDPNPVWLRRTFTPPWSGPVWISPNQILVEEGLVPIAEAFADPSHSGYNKPLAERVLMVAGHIALKTRELLAGSVSSMECYSATDGHGIRVPDFMWSNIGLHFENYEAAEQQIRASEKSA